MSDPALTPEQVRALARLWWVPVGLGVLAILLGGLILSKPGHSLSTLATAVGIYVVIDGTVELALAARRKRLDREASVILGAINVIVGILLIRHPIDTPTTIGLEVGFWLISIAALRAVLAFNRPGERLWLLVQATVNAVFGVILLAGSHMSYSTLAELLGFSFAANGLALVALGIGMRFLDGGGARPNLAVA